MRVDVAKQARANTDFSSVFEQRRYQMYEKLFLDKQFGGLESALNRDEAQMRADRAGTEVKRADAEIKRTEASLINSESLVLQAEATGLSTLATTRRDLRRAEQNLFSVERDLQEIDNRIERFKARYVTAPCDGIVFRISANVAEGGQFVKEGEDLAILVPDTNDRVVELLIDGMDAPLIAAFMQERGEGPHVRLQFEGWPAIQFAGWPSVATGTFGGKVRQIDATDDGNGRFRVLVEPEELVEADRWPDAQFLRQGNQAVGWVFLNKVSLGYELWRNLNGFPPVVAPKSNDKYKEGGKPPKVKPL
jgi:biotin carboxyl carrier protein